jgi:hypothetical protein
MLYIEPGSPKLRDNLLDGEIFSKSQRRGY